MNNSWLSYESLGLLQGICFQSIEIDQLRIQIHGIRYTESDTSHPLHPHQHDFFEFHYIADGAVNTVINGVERTYLAGQYYLMTPKLLHAHSNRGSCPAESHRGFALRWGLETVTRAHANPEMEAMKNILYNAAPYPVSDEGSRVSALVREMLEMAGSGCTNTELKLAFASILILLARGYQNPYIDEARTAKGDSETEVINAAIAYIQAHCCEPISVGDIAEAVHLSYSHLSRLFAKHSFESISNHIVRYRIDRAQHLLLTSDFSVGQIAEMVGFSTVSHFSNTFRKLVGMSPMKYRASTSQFEGGIPTQM